MKSILTICLIAVSFVATAQEVFTKEKTYAIDSCLRLDQGIGSLLSDSMTVTEILGVDSLYVVYDKCIGSETDTIHVKQFRIVTAPFNGPVSLWTSPANRIPETAKKIISKLKPGDKVILENVIVSKEEEELKISAVIITIK